MSRHLIALFLLTCTSCASVRPQSTATVTPAPTTARPSPTATSVPPTVTVTPLSCLSKPGEIIVEEYLDADMPRSLPYRIYLPPCYERRAGTSLPVLILLHGLQLTDSQWEDLGVNEAADALIRSGALRPMVIVMPWERRGLDFEAAIVGKLLPYIRQTYAGDGGRENTAIGGVSRGAGWALRIGLKHPELFGSIGLHSPAVLPPDMYFIRDWIEAARQGAGVPRIWVDVAERDTSRAGAKDLAALLDRLGVTYAWSSAPGEHSAPYWSSRLNDYLRWYGEGWGGLPAGTATTPP
jgi:enterochelin esterase-like enzyme